MLKRQHPEPDNNNAPKRTGLSEMFDGVSSDEDEVSGSSGQDAEEERTCLETVGAAISSGVATSR